MVVNYVQACDSGPGRLRTANSNVASASARREADALRHGLGCGGGRTNTRRGACAAHLAMQPSSTASDLAPGWRDTPSTAREPSAHTGPQAEPVFTGYVTLQTRGSTSAELNRDGWGALSRCRRTVRVTAVEALPLKLHLLDLVLISFRSLKDIFMSLRWDTLGGGSGRVPHHGHGLKV